jgi:hypothetical protein
VQPWRSREQVLADPGAGVDQVLAVVECEQQPSRPQRVSDRVQQRTPWLLADADDRGDDGHHRLGLTQVAQFDEPGTVGELIGCLGEDSQGEPRLADPSGTAQCEGTRRLYQLTQLTELPLAANEPIRPLGQVGLDLSYLTPLPSLADSFPDGRR